MTGGVGGIDWRGVVTLVGGNWTYKLQKLD